MRKVPSIAARQVGVFSARQAFREGWTRSQLSYSARTGRITRLRAGAYQTTDLSAMSTFERQRWLHAAPAVAAVLTTPGALASHSTAAVLRGLPLAFLPHRPCVSVVPWHTGEISQVHVHRCTAAPQTLPVGEVGCSSVERTLIDLAREHGLAGGVVPMDVALRNGSTTFDRLYTELDRCVRWPGVRTAREAIALADPLSESPLESQSRLKFGKFGLPQPEAQVRIGNTAGQFVARVDFYWDKFGVVGEADGAVKYEGIDVSPLHEEKKRQEALENLGLTVVRWGYADLHDFEPVSMRLRRAFRRPKERGWIVLPRL